MSEEMSLREGLEIIHNECRKNFICDGDCKFYGGACITNADIDLTDERFNKAIEICKQIKEENKMTYAKDFISKFPNCEREDIHKLCVPIAYGKEHEPSCCVDIACRDCWNRVYKEDKHGNKSVITQE